MSKVWVDETGNMFHDGCFEPGESREGYTEVTNLDEDDECDSCGGFFVEPSDDDDDDEDQGDQEEMIPDK